MTAETTCYCSVCREVIALHDFATKQVADYKVYDFDGDLEEIQLAHKDCAIAEDARQGTKYWEYD